MRVVAPEWGWRLNSGWCSGRRISELDAIWALGPSHCLAPRRCATSAYQSEDLRAPHPGAPPTPTGDAVPVGRPEAHLCYFSPFPTGAAALSEDAGGRRSIFDPRFNGSVPISRVPLVAADVMNGSRPRGGRERA